MRHDKLDMIFLAFICLGLIRDAVSLRWTVLVREPVFVNSHATHRQNPRCVDLPTTGFSEPDKCGWELKRLFDYFSGDCVR